MKANVALCLLDVYKDRWLLTLAKPALTDEDM